MTTPAQPLFDMSKAQPINGGAPLFDMSKAQPIETAQPAPSTGIGAGIKRNTVDALTGLYHAFNSPATDEEKQAILGKVREANAKGDKVPEELATNPSRSTLAMHRILDAPAEELQKKGGNEMEVAKDLLNNHQYWKGGNLYLSGLADKLLGHVPVVGPAINSIVQRAEGALIPAINKKGEDIPSSQIPEERKDFSGAATDVGAGLALENAPKIVEGASKAAGKVAGKVGDLGIPSTKRAGAALAEVESAAGDVPIDMKKPGNTALELYEQSQRGATLPKAVRDLVTRATKPDAPPLTYSEAKDFQSNISKLSANEKLKLNANTKRLVGQLNQDLHESLTEAADTKGKGEQFTKAMKEYHNAMKLKGFTDEAISIAWKSALGGLGLGAGKKLLDLIP